jgi:hypothetical protein
MIKIIKQCFIGCKVIHANGSTDDYDVVFVSSNWLVAVKDEELYRLDQRI